VGELFKENPFGDFFLGQGIEANKIVPLGSEARHPIDTPANGSCLTQSPWGPFLTASAPWPWKKKTGKGFI